MDIEQEIENFLYDSMKDNDQKYRDIQLILFFFGFREEDWPTLDATAIRFEVGESENRKSERPRQIIKNKFTSKVQLTEFPSIRRVSEVISSQDYMSTDVLIEKLEELKLLPKNYSVKGILNLLHQLGLCKSYDIYTNKLNKASRSSISNEKTLYVIHSSELKKMKSAMNRMIVFPGLVGIANLSTFFETHPQYKKYKEALFNILHSRDDVWLSSFNGVFYYIIENRDNALINNLEKVVNVADSVELEVMVNVLSNAFKHRTPPKGNSYPPIEVISSYLKKSRYTECNGKVIKLNINPTKLRDIEYDVVNFMKGKGQLGFSIIKEHLELKGYSKPSIDKAILHSTIVNADKSVRRHYKYSLLESIPFESTKELDRYTVFKDRLLSICAEGTDDEIESKRRKEQQVLRQWLFEGKEKACCAICNNLFSVDSLVTAHKKPRSICSFNERIDPNIVMPLCKFGCDHAYEANYISVKQGVVQKNNRRSGTEFENAWVNTVVGNVVNAQWLEGEANYFGS